jgi:hypothetical protein
MSLTMPVRIAEGHTLLRLEWETSIRRREEAEAIAAGEAARQRLPRLLRPLLGWAVSDIVRDNYLRACHKGKRLGDAAEDAVLGPLADALADDPARWLVLRGVVLQRRRDLRPLELDIVTLGPAGIAITETKAWAGRIYLTDSTAYVLRDGQWEERKSPLVQLRAATGLVIGLVAEAGLPYIPIHTSVCFPWAQEAPVLQASPEEAARCPVFWGRTAGADLAKTLLSLPRYRIDIDAILQAMHKGGLQLAAYHENTVRT